VTTLDHHAYRLGDVFYGENSRQNGQYQRTTDGASEFAPPAI
jgi:hypothetical protein